MTRRKRLAVAFVAAALLVMGLSACRNETQNRIRRSIQEYTAQRMYITIYSYDGKVVFTGLVDGKVTRSGNASEGGSGSESLGDYIYWYDERGRYLQTDLPYLVSTYDRNVPAAP
ncbi:MAG: hypothetical protein H3C53_07025 [Trueperaceae bacterium]|nr:hypothetical protein [Trueperaceae bacterium]